MPQRWDVHRFRDDGEGFCASCGAAEDDERFHDPDLPFPLFPYRPFGAIHRSRTGSTAAASRGDDQSAGLPSG